MDYFRKYLVFLHSLNRKKTCTFDLTLSDQTPNGMYMKPFKINKHDIYETNLSCQEQLIDRQARTRIKTFSPTETLITQHGAWSPASSNMKLSLDASDYVFLSRLTKYVILKIGISERYNHTKMSLLWLTYSWCGQDLRFTQTNLRQRPILHIYKC